MTASTPSHLPSVTGNLRQFLARIDTVLLEDRVDLDKVALDKLPGSEVASDCSPHPIRVCPCPVCALIRISGRKRDLVDHIVGAARSVNGNTATVCGARAS